MSLIGVDNTSEFFKYRSDWNQNYGQAYVFYIIRSQVILPQTMLIVHMRK